MIPNTLLTRLTGRQQRVMQMRYGYGWTIPQIARRLNVRKQSVQEMIERAHMRAGFPRLPRGRVRSAQPRRVVAMNLSEVNNC